MEFEKWEDVALKPVIFPVSEKWPEDGGEE